jgi:hypothetical protein
MKKILSVLIGASLLLATHTEAQIASSTSNGVTLTLYAIKTVNVNSSPNWVNQRAAIINAMKAGSLAVGGDRSSDPSQFVISQALQAGDISESDVNHSWEGLVPGAFPAEYGCAVLFGASVAGVNVNPANFLLFIGSSDTVGGTNSLGSTNRYTGNFGPGFQGSTTSSGDTWIAAGTLNSVDRFNHVGIGDTYHGNTQGDMDLIRAYMNQQPGPFIMTGTLVSLDPATGFTNNSVTVQVSTAPLPSPPTLSLFNNDDGTGNLTVFGQMGVKYDLQASTDLLGRIWQTFVTIGGTNSVSTYAGLPLNQPMQFFRASVHYPLSQGGMQSVRRRVGAPVVIHHNGGV